MPGVFDAMGHRDFRLFWLAAVVSNSGGWMQTAAIPYVAFALTGREGGVGVTGFWQAIPIMLMSLLGGALADRFDRRQVMVWTQLMAGAISLALWIAYSSGRMSIGLLNLLGFMSGIATGINIPIWQSLVAQLVPSRDLPNAVTWNSTQFNAARAIGTFAAGVVIAWWSPGATFFLNAVSFLAVVGVLVVIRPRPVQRRAGSLRMEITVGVRSVRQNPVLVMCCISIALISSIGSPMFTFLTGSIGQGTLGLHGWRLGVLWACSGVGAIAVAPTLLKAPAGSRRARLATATLGYGVGIALVGVAPWWWLACFGVAIFGASYLGIASTLNTTVQLSADESTRGASLAIYIMCLTASLPVGLLTWGAIADRVGIRWVAGVAGLVMVIVALGMASLPQVGVLDRTHGAAATP